MDHQNWWFKFYETQNIEDKLQRFHDFCAQKHKSSHTHKRHSLAVGIENCLYIAVSTKTQRFEHPVIKLTTITANSSHSLSPSLSLCLSLSAAFCATLLDSQTRWLTNWLVSAECFVNADSSELRIQALLRCANTASGCLSCIISMGELHKNSLGY